MPDYLPGEIIVVPFPYTDMSTTKVRPAMVLSDEDHNSSEKDLVVCGLTSRLANSAHSVLIADQDMESGKLPRPSRVKATKVVAIDKRVVRARVGRVRPETFARVMREFEAAFTNG